MWPIKPQAAYVSGGKVESFRSHMNLLDKWAELGQRANQKSGDTHKALLKVQARFCEQI